MNTIAEGLVIDDRSSHSFSSNLDNEWRMATDQVMGGISQGNFVIEQNHGRSCLRMKGQVSTENNGGFLQMVLDLKNSQVFDAYKYEGIKIDVAGNNEEYNLHIKTANLTLPWQSYRYTFLATPEWDTILIPFSQLTPHRVTCPFRPEAMRSLGLVAIGKNFDADLCLGAVSFYGKQ